MCRLNFIYSISGPDKIPVYVGATDDFNCRRKFHLSQPLNSNHHNYELQEWYDNLKDFNIHFNLLEICLRQESEIREGVWINKFLSQNIELFNICRHVQKL